MRDVYMGIIEDSVVPAARQDRVAAYREFAELARLRAERKADEARRHMALAAIAYRYAERAVARLRGRRRAQSWGN